MNPAGQPAGREPALDGLRGVAILLVLGFHGIAQVYSHPGVPVLDTLKQVTGIGGSGVDLFFVLSGFLIGRNLIAHKDATNLYRVFHARRACRILPAYLLLLAGFLCARHLPALVTVGGGRLFGEAVPFWSYLVFCQNNLMGALRTIGPWWLVVTWSLAVEGQFYLLAPFMRRMALPLLFWLAGAVVLLSPLGRWWLVTKAANPAGAIYLTVVRLDALLLGFVLAAMDHARPGAGLSPVVRRVLAAWMWLFGGLALLAPLFRPDVWNRVALVLGPTFCAFGFGALLVWIRSDPGSFVSRLLTQCWLRGLGNLSYFVYLFHLPAIYTLHALLRQRLPAHLHWTDALITLAALLLTIVMAAISRMLLELPFIRIGQNLKYASRSRTRPWNFPLGDYGPEIPGK